MLDQKKIGVIGNGHMAHFLCKKLLHTACPIDAIYARNEEGGRQLALQVDAIYFSDISAFWDSVDIVLLAINDDAIAELVASFPKSENKIIIHHSGTKSMSILSSRTSHTGVLWPVYSINKFQLPEHRNIPMVLEASDYEASKVVEIIASEISNIHQFLPESKRQMLHLMAVLSNNFINHLCAVTQEFGNEHQLPFDWVLPIIHQTVDRLGASNIALLQTGPAVRGDESTMDAHRSLLANHSALLSLYNALSQSIIDFHNKSYE